MLRGRVNEYLVLACDGERDLAFKVEMILATDSQGAPQAVRSAGERFGAVTFSEGVIRQQSLISGESLVDGHKRRLRTDLDLCQLRGPASGISRFGDYGEEYLAVELDDIFRKDRIVAFHRTAIVPTRNVGRGEHTNHTRGVSHGLQVETRDATACDRRSTRRNVERALRFPNVVDIRRAPAHLPRRGIVWRGTADNPCAHVSRMPTMRVWRVGVPLTSISAFRNKARATSIRYPALAR